MQSVAIHAPRRRIEVFRTAKVDAAEERQDTGLQAAALVAPLPSAQLLSEKWVRKADQAQRRAERRAAAQRKRRRAEAAQKK